MDETPHACRHEAEMLIAKTRAIIARDGYAVAQGLPFDRVDFGECYACHHPAVIGCDEDGTQVLLALVEG